MNKLIDIRKTHETGDISKQDYIEAIHARHASLFEYINFMDNTDVEAIKILKEGIYVRSRSQQIELYLDSRDQHLVPYTLMNFRSYECAETEFLKSIAQSDWTILDIGANCGWYALALAKRWPTAKIHAFEPIPHTYEILQRNIHHNGVSNIQTHRLAFSNQETVLDFLYTPDCSGATSLVKAGQPGSTAALERIACPATTLDMFCARQELAPQLIKCDVEGAELLVVQGGEETIATHRPVILLELLRKWSREFEYHPNDVLNLLSKHGYRAYTLDANTKLAYCESINEDTEQTNFFFLNQDQHRNILSGLDFMKTSL